MEDTQNQPREIDWDDLDISKEWTGTEYQKDYWKWSWLEKYPGADHEHGG
jgi:hypothetical protein